MSYYRIIDDKKYEDKLLKVAEEVVKGQGNGRISLANTQKLLEKVKDDNFYTDIEERYNDLHPRNFKWTEEADEWLRTKICKWTTTKGKEQKT